VETRKGNRSRHEPSSNNAADAKRPPSEGRFNDSGVDEDACMLRRALAAKATPGEDGGSIDEEDLTKGGMAWDWSRGDGEGGEDGEGEEQRMEVEQGRRGRGAGSLGTER